MEKFDWRKAVELEKTYRTNWNIRKLADINIEFCEKFGCGHTYKTRLPKASFYLGRLNAVNELNEFFERNQINFLLGGFETLELSEKCVGFGNQYENLPQYMRAEIRAYFSNPAYAELFIEMMFDYEYYIEDVKPFDFSIRKIRNTEFSDNLVRDVAKGIVNFDVTKFYDRSKNNIVEITFFEDSIPGVHFILDITQISNKRIGSIVELILGRLNTSINPYKENVIKILTGEENEEYANDYGFNGTFISEIAKYLHDERLVINKSKPEIESDLSIMLALDFLQFVNQKEHN